MIDMRAAFSPRYRFVLGRWGGGNYWHNVAVADESGKSVHDELEDEDEGIEEKHQSQTAIY